MVIFHSYVSLPEGNPFSSTWNLNKPKNGWTCRQRLLFGDLFTSSHWIFGEDGSMVTQTAVVGPWALTGGFKPAVTVTMAVIVIIPVDKRIIHKANSCQAWINEAGLMTNIGSQISDHITPIYYCQFILCWHGKLPPSLERFSQAARDPGYTQDIFGHRN